MTTHEPARAKALATALDVAKSKLDVAWLGERGEIKNHVFSYDARGAPP